MLELITGSVIRPIIFFIFIPQNISAALCASVYLVRQAWRVARKQNLTDCGGQ